MIRVGLWRWLDAASGGLHKAVMKPIVALSTLILLGVFLDSAGAAPVEIVPKSLRGAKQPQAALTGDGALAVVFGRDTNVYFVRSIDGGKSFEMPVLVGALPKLALGMRRGPRIVSSQRGLVISAISHADGNLVAWHSADGGKTWPPASRVNSSDRSAREGLHAMTGDAAGRVHLAWLDLRNGKTELWMASSTNGGSAWGENRLVYQSPSGSICECCHPSLALDGQGQLWAMWRNSIDGARDMFLSVSGDGGRTFSEARKLGAASWTLPACPMDGGQIVVGNDRTPQTVWRRNKSIMMTDVTGEKTLSLSGTQPIGARVDETAYWLWQQGSELIFKRDAAGTVVLDRNGGYASIAASQGRSRPFAVWESTVDGEKTIVGSELP